jgi:ASC-1-like (ASCH) protein
MNNNFLEKIKDDPDFAQLFAKKAVEIRQTKANLVEAARNYQDKYSEEIEQGTIKHALKLTEGRNKGLKDDEIFRDNQLFIPTKQTPILNYLYFLLRETKFEDLEIDVLRLPADVRKDLQLLKEEYEQKYGAAVHEKMKEAPLPNMVSYIYKNIGDETFATIKKLKTLSQSSNEAEAFSAYRKCLDMCKKYNLEFDKIPLNN